MFENFHSVSPGPTGKDRRAAPASTVPSTCPEMASWTRVRPFLIGLAVLLMAGASAQAASRKPVKSLLELRQNRVIVQKWDISCGAAALGTLLNHQHGDMISERDIAKALFKRDEYIENPYLVLEREGFSLLDLKLFVEKRGYQGIGYGKLTLDDLLQHGPVIVPLNMHGYNHFVVFRGMRGNRVLLADPAWGNRTMRVERFETAWIDSPEVGRVGFVVARKDGVTPPNLLVPTENDFLILK